jgi:acyl-coenzyme A synthetase/AMP-(fatty) acid ligase
MSEDEQKQVLKKVKKFSSQTGMLYKLSGIHFIDKLPMTSVGKVKRYKLKEQILASRV